MILASRGQKRAQLSSPSSHRTVVIWHVICGAGQHVWKVCTKLFLEIDDCSFIADKLQRASPFSLWQRRQGLPASAAWLVSWFRFTPNPSRTNRGAHLGHVTGCILEVQLVENTEDVITVLPRWRLHQRFSQPLLLKVIPPEHKTDKSCISVQTVGISDTLICSRGFPYLSLM